MPMAPAPAASSSAVVASPAPPDRELVVVRPAPDVGRGIASEDDGLLVVPTVLEPGGPALVVHDLRDATRAPRVIGVGAAGRPRFVSASRVLVHDAEGKQVFSVALDGSALTRAACAIEPVVSSDGRVAATITPAGRIVFLDTATLAPTWQPELGAVSPGDVSLSFATPSVLVVSRPDGGSVLDRVGKRVLFDVTIPDSIIAKLVVSGGGRYAAFVRAADFDVRLSVLSLEDGKKLEWTQRSGFVPALSFGIGETRLVTSVSPEEVTVVDLPSMQRRQVRTGIHLDNEGYSYYTGEIALTEDGNQVCGHPVTSIGKYTDEARIVYADLRRPGTRPWKTAKCFIRGERAHVIPLTGAVAREGRVVVGTIAATYTRTSNELLSPDASLSGIVTAKADAHHMRWLGAEMSLVERASGKVRVRLPLGDAPAGMGEHLASTFSPRGRWLVVTWGDATMLFDPTTGARLSPAGGASEWDLAWSPQETFLFGSVGAETVRLVMLPSGVARDVPAFGSRCLRRGELLPAAACAVPLSPAS